MQHLDVSAVILFQNDEEIVGTAVTRLAEFLRAQGLGFELLAVDVASHDNSTALLALMRKQVLELRIVTTAPARTPHLHAAQIARGQAVWFVTPDAANASLEAFPAAFQQITRGERELVAISDRFALADRTRVIASLRGLRSQGRQLPRELMNRPRPDGETARAGTSTRQPGKTRSGWLAPLLSMLALERSPW